MLKIVEDLGTRKDVNNVSRRWCKALCSYCGSISEHRTQSLKNKQSCGCATHLKAHIKHGMSNTRQYQIWADMKDRCNNKKNKSYIRYGQRGIGYDIKWNTFEGFWEDMKDSYFDSGTIERLDNNKGYNKSNCIWITIEEQVKNRSEINTYKKRTKESYARKISLSDISFFGEKYKIAKYGEGKSIIKNMSNTLGISVNTSAIYLIKYKKDNLCKLI